MAKLHCLTSDNGKMVLIKDYGDSSKYAVLNISKVDVIVKTEEEHSKALLWNPK